MPKVKTTFYKSHIDFFFFLNSVLHLALAMAYWHITAPSCFIRNLSPGLYYPLSCLLTDGAWRETRRGCRKL